MKLKRLLAGFIAVAMTATMMPALVFADEAESGSEPVAVEEPETKEEEKKPAEKKPEAKEEKPEPKAEAKEEPKAEEPAEEDKADDSKEADKVKGEIPPETDSVDEVDAKSGKLGKLKWAIKGTTLTISGKGNMKNCAYGKYPWDKYSMDIEKVVIKKGVKSIGNSAFRELYSLKSVSLPKGLKTIGSHAFEEAIHLEKINFPSSLRTIGSDAFNGCYSGNDGLKEVKLNSGLKTIGSHAFAYCGNLEKVNIPGSVKTIGKSAFNGDYNLKGTITIPGGVSKIGDSAFEGAAIEKVVIKSGVKEIGEYAFAGCEDLADVTIPSSVKKIGSSAFVDCTSLKEIDLPYGLKEIADNTFSGSGLEIVEIPYGVTTIDMYAFMNCEKLVTVIIDSSVTSIGEGAFQGCTSLYDITMMEDLYNATYGKDPSYSFDGCTKLKANNISFLEENNLLEVNGKTATVKYSKLKKKNQTLPWTSVLEDTVKGQGVYLFTKASGNKKITIGYTSGTVTVQKKLKKGTYKIKVKVLATGDAIKAATDWKEATITIKVK